VEYFRFSDDDFYDFFFQSDHNEESTGDDASDTVTAHEELILQKLNLEKIVTELNAMERDASNTKITELNDQLQQQRRVVEDLQPTVNEKVIRQIDELVGFQGSVPVNFRDITMPQLEALKQLEGFDLRQMNTAEIQKKLLKLKEDLERLESSDAEQAKRFSALQNDFEDKWKTAANFPAKEEFMRRFSSLKFINESPCLLKVFNSIQAALNQHMHVAAILLTGKVESSAGKSAQAISILAMEADALPFRGTIAAVAGFGVKHVGEAKRKKRYGHFGELIPSYNPNDAAQVFEQIAVGIVLTNGDIIKRVEGNNLANSEIREICKELNPLTHSLRNDVVDVAVYTKFLANRAKENILNGNLNRSKINSMHRKKTV
jgi:hypothetical protein